MDRPLMGIASSSSLPSVASRINLHSQELPSRLQRLINLLFLGEMSSACIVYSVSVLFAFPLFSPFASFLVGGLRACLASSIETTLALPSDRCSPYLLPPERSSTV